MENPSPNRVQALLTFKKFITPRIVEYLFWIGVAGALLIGIVMMFGGVFSERGGGPMVFGGLLYLLLGPIVVRIYCELLIVIFSIHDTLIEIKDQLKTK